MAEDGSKGNARPLFIYWQFPSITTPDGEIRGYTATRSSTKYLKFAQFLVNNPPDKTPFRPSKVPMDYQTILAYKKDVMNWVSRQMIISMKLHRDSKEEELFANTIQALHNLPWSPGSAHRGFYLVMPNPREIKAVKRDDLWGLKGLGKGSMPYLKATGLGYWAEPDFANMETWEARKTILSILRTFENLAQAALTGRRVAQLEPKQIKTYLQSATQDLARALPEIKD